MSISRKKLLLMLLATVCLMAAGAFALWTRLTRPAADPRRATTTVLSASAPAQATDTVDVERRELPRIQPGATLGPRPPEGWSHLVLLGKPRVAEGDTAKVPPMLANLVSRFHLVIVANIASSAASPLDYALENVAIGLATPVDGDERVVSTATLDSLGPKLDFVERNSLSGNEASLDQALQVARTGTMWVFDATAIQRVDNANKHVWHRHALVVDPATGRLRTFLWSLDPDASAKVRLIHDTIRLLPAALVEDRRIYVDASHFVLGIPSQEGFALVDLPPGTDVALSAELTAAAASALEAPDEVRRLEALLRAIPEPAADRAPEDSTPEPERAAEFSRP